jgi:hypothetical protein
MDEQQKPQPDLQVYQDAEIVDYGSAADIVRFSGSGALDDGSGSPFYSS